ncbi:MAG TPA: ROK family transcriptional regulator [Longilinea sp.]|nr:ROK family transcriptional regulator [Longilinea sp.]
MNTSDYLPAINAGAMHDINRTAILEIIRRESPISRTAIAERLELSLPTVMRIVDELFAEGLVKSHGDTEWSGGRRRPLLQFNSEESVVVGVDLGGPIFYGAVSDLGGNIIEELEITRLGSSSEDNFARTLTLIDALLKSEKIKGRKVRGIGIGVPGVTDHKTGIVTWAYSLNWRNFPLREMLEEKYDLPLIVDNDMNLAALGELWFGKGQDTRNMILFTVTTGIGAGIIIDRELYRGSTNSSGEIGNMLPGREFLGQNFGDFGALETNASFTGIIRLARNYLHLSPDQPLGGDEIFAAYREGKTWAIKLIDEMVQYLAVAIANLTVSFDPDLIILCGDVTRFANMLIEPIVNYIDSSIPTPPKLVMSDLGRKAVAMGAITNVLHNTTNFIVVRKLT